MARKLAQSHLFRVVYRIIEPEGVCFSSRRKTVVADSLQEAIERVREHEKAEQSCKTIEISEVVREGIEVWV